MGGRDPSEERQHRKDGAASAKASGSSGTSRVTGKSNVDFIVEGPSTRPSLSAGGSMVSLPGYTSTTELLDHPEPVDKAAFTNKESHEPPTTKHDGPSSQRRHHHPRPLRLPIAFGLSATRADKPAILSPIPDTPNRNNDAAPSPPQPAAGPSPAQEPDTKPPGNLKRKGGFQTFFVSGSVPRL